MFLVQFDTDNYGEATWEAAASILDDAAVASLELELESLIQDKGGLEAAAAAYGFDAEVLLLPPRSGESGEPPPPPRPPPSAEAPPGSQVRKSAAGKGGRGFDAYEGASSADGEGGGGEEVATVERGEEEKEEEEEEEEGEGEGEAENGVDDGSGNVGADDDEEEGTEEPDRNVYDEKGRRLCNTFGCILLNNHYGMHKLPVGDVNGPRGQRRAASQINFKRLAKSGHSNRPEIGEGRQLGKPLSVRERQAGGD